MNTMVIYVLKASVYLMTFYLIYSFMLKKDTAYGRNRAFILFAIIFSMLLPYITFQPTSPLNVRFFGLLSEVFVSPSGDKGFTALNLPGYENTVYTIYILGVIIFLLKLVFDISNLAWLILRHRRTGSRIIRFHGFNTAGFSAMGYIFINSALNPEETGQIINHERNHLRQNHYIDIVFIEIVTAFLWFNPFIYFMNRELRALHEFQADRDCLKSGIPIVNYQSLLLAQVFRTGSVKLTNSFSNPSLVRKRMVMMTRQQTSRLASLKLLSVIPVAGFVFMSLSVSNENMPAAGDEIPFVVVEQMPQFPGGNDALFKFIRENTIYPEEAKIRNIQGRVIVKFCITATGEIDKISLVQSVYPELDEEAMRVIGNLPDFIPGRQGGRPVPVWFSMPISFSLK